MKFLKDLGMRKPKENSKYLVRYGLYICPSCGNEFEAITNNVKRGLTTQCKSCASITHGLSDHKLCDVWHNIKSRCLNKEHKDYGRYGGRGITICDEWKDDLKGFYNWAVVNGYKNGLKIDRIDNNGIYEPKNCRWVTQNIQSRNTKKLYSDNTSGFRGVSWDESTKKWLARIGVNGKQIKIGRFKTKEDAAKAYDAYVLENDLEHTINFEDG